MLVRWSILFFMLITYPVLSIFDLPKTIGQIPLLYGYIFMVWVLFVTLIAFVVGKGGQENER